MTVGGIANTDLTLDKTTLTFTPSNWDTAQTVKVTAGQDDDAVDEEVVNITHAVSSTADADYDGATAGSVAVTVTDDDTAGVTVSETSLEIEEGDFDTYTIVLDTEPAGDVTVTVGGIANTDLILDKTTLTFTTVNWNTAQTVKVTAEQDDDAVNEEVVNITHAVSSTGHSRIRRTGRRKRGRHGDGRRRCGVTISETSLEIEEGDFDSYTVVLDTEPTGDVTVTVGGIANTDLTLDKTTLTFHHRQLGHGADGEGHGGTGRRRGGRRGGHHHPRRELDCRRRLRRCHRRKRRRHRDRRRGGISRIHSHDGTRRRTGTPTATAR